MEKVRKLGSKASRSTQTYYLTIPSEYISELGWQKGQKLVVKISKSKKQVTIQDWEG